MNKQEQRDLALATILNVDNEFYEEQSRYERCSTLLGNLLCNDYELAKNMQELVVQALVCDRSKYTFDRWSSQLMAALIQALRLQYSEAINARVLGMDKLDTQ